MNEHRIKLMKGFEKKTGSLVDQVELLTDGELQHLNDYDAAEEVCRRLTSAAKHLRLAAFELGQAEAAAELEDMQDEMQRSLEMMSG